MSESLRERLAAYSPQAVKEMEEERNKEFVLENYWPANKGPLHFRGRITIEDQPAYITSDYGDREVLVVHIDPSATIIKENPKNVGALTFTVNLPSEDRTPSRNSELIMTVESAQELPNGKMINNYFDFHGKEVEFKADVLILPPRKGQQYGVRIWHYKCLSVKGPGSAEKPEEAAPSIISPNDAAELLSLITSLGESATKMQILQAASQAFTSGQIAFEDPAAVNQFIVATSNLAEMLEKLLAS